MGYGTMQLQCVVEAGEQGLHKAVRQKVGCHSKLQRAGLLFCIPTALEPLKDEDIACHVQKNVSHLVSGFPSGARMSQQVESPGI